jgi:valyl-tRNA synthetase
MLEKHYKPAEIESAIYRQWEESGAFRAGSKKAKKKGGKAPETFCIVIPPPNVTGSLHMGHALNNTLQDILCRFERMRGKDVLWQPGTDHAGIATQMVVERQLMERQQPDRRAMGRDKFVERVWEWKAESGGTIIGQLKRLGASCDWSRERFTMDEGLSDAVLRVFVQLYKEGLIYRAKRLVNWDPHFETAISDLEVENKEVDGFMWHFKYPLENGETYEYVEKDADGNVTFRETRDYISIATTRPETMLGDGAVAVHPSDERYAPIVGKLCEIPVGPKEYRRLIPIITDEYPDPTFGSGAVKITGAHDFNDYAVAKRAGIPMYSLMDTKGHMRNDGKPYAEEAATAQRIAKGEEDFDEAKIAAMNLVPDEYRGLRRFGSSDSPGCRERVVADITAEGLAVMTTDEAGNATPLVEKKKIMQPFGDRSGVVIEPFLTDQWFADAKKLAEPALAAVRQGDTKFVPQNWEKTYFQWLENIEPWCVSRQLWWGHQIPVWYGPKNIGQPFSLIDVLGNGEPFCATNEESAVAAAKAYYRKQTDKGIQIEVQSLEKLQQRNIGREAGGDNREAAAPMWAMDGNEVVVTIYRDPDVLDTWFSSALWPFSTLGWPENTPELKRYYPNAVLVTGFDIIFFWVARMMMMGMHFMKEIPFRDIYIHALVRDEKGQKMSKSKGNVMDPLDIIDGIDLNGLIEKRVAALAKKDDRKRIERDTKKDYPNGIDGYGADALRFTLAAMAAQGRDVKLSMARIEGYRNFSTKLWNAARFGEMNECKPVKGFKPKAAKESINRWIAGEVQRTAAAVTQGLEQYRFNEAAGAIYQFVWGTFCDWYVELAKPVLSGADETAKTETRAMFAWALDQILALLHPFKPFITEALWQKIGETSEGRDTMLVVADWPELSGLEDAKADEEIRWLIELISEVRSVRSEMNVPPGAQIPVVISGAGKALTARVERHQGTLSRLARLSSIAFDKTPPKGAVQIVMKDATVALPLAGVIDLRAEGERLKREIDKVAGEIEKLDQKLADEKFTARAPEHVIEENRERLELAAATRKRLSEALKRLQAAA